MSLLDEHGEKGESVLARRRKEEDGRQDGTHLAVLLDVGKELPQVVARVVTLDVLVRVDDARREVLLVRLTLKDCRGS